MNKFLPILAFSLLFTFSVSSFAQSSFSVRYREAQVCFEKKEYRKAITLLQRAKESPGTSAEQKKQAEDLLRRCNAEIDRSSRAPASIGQKERPKHLLKVSTHPSGADIYIENVLGNEMLVENGDKRIIIEKAGYERIDTTITVTNATAALVFPLTPEFGSVCLSITGDRLLPFSNGPSLSINGHQVDLNPVLKRSFSANEDIRYYELYENSVIPLPPGSYTLSLSAEGYHSVEKSFSVDRNTSQSMALTLDPFAGYLTITEDASNTGAAVFIDDILLGQIPVQHCRIPIGKHKITLEKEGFAPVRESYSVSIREGIETKKTVKMCALPAGKEARVLEVICQEGNLFLTLTDENGTVLIDEEAIPGRFMIPEGFFETTLTVRRKNGRILKKGALCPDNEKGEVHLFVKTALSRIPDAYESYIRF